MILRRPFNIVIIACYCLVFAVANAAQNKEEVINLEANNVNYDYKKGIIHYQGDVHATQGHTELFADQMTVYYNEKHKIKEIRAIGNLANYKTILNEKDVLNASAKNIFYYPLLGKVVLENNAQVTYNENLFSGPYIYYDMIKKVISSHPKKVSQSKIILEPIKQLKTQLK